ncbi:MAG: hypothetical protein QF687_06730 [Nitrospinaceae bacterium]|nr:hypothetical protein [Nitrospinaceae bacterium]
MKTFVRCVVLLGVAVTFLQPACQQNDAPAGNIVRDLGELLGVPLAGEEDPGPSDTPVGGAPGAVGKNRAEEKEVLVIGEKLKAGMPLDAALSLLGTPKSIEISRGTEPEVDSISIEYKNHGLKIHALTKENRVEELEVLPTFNGEFSSGVKIGTEIPDLIKTFGTPVSKDASIIEYPEMRMYLFLKNDTLASARLFARNSRLLDYRLLKK